MSVAEADRLTAEDSMSLAADHGTVPMQVGAILFFGAPAPVGQLRRVWADRARGVRRLRQRLSEPSRGRAAWVDAEDFDPARHITVHACASDRNSVFALATHLVGERLDRHHPLWRVVLLAGPAGLVHAQVLVVHHVLADGLAAFALLADLADPTHPHIPSAPAVRTAGVPRPLLRGRAPMPVRVRAAAARAGTVVAGALGPVWTPVRRTSLNQPSGTGRRLASLGTDLEAVRRAAHRSGATVNDVALTLYAGALGEELASRGEPLNQVVMSVPFATGARGGAGLGNASAVAPVSLPTSGAVTDRLARTARVTQALKSRPRGASNRLLVPLFGALAATGAFRWFIDHQHFVHTFATNVRGPAQTVAFGGHPITDVIPLTVVTGNITVALATTSYVGRLSFTLVTDTAHGPDPERLAASFAQQLRTLLAADA